LCGCAGKGVAWRWSSMLSAVMIISIGMPFVVVLNPTSLYFCLVVVVCFEVWWVCPKWRSATLWRQEHTS
jgi:hypothetical protein